MRIIAGQYRGRRLVTPAGLNTRPILDRVKASVFDWLGSRLAMPGHLPPLNVCDVFCGAGSQGIEALSRGAEFCAFVESDRAALEALRANLTAIGAGPRALVVDRPAQSLTLSRHAGRGFGLVFIDPPYELSRDLKRGSVMMLLLERLGANVPLEAGALLIWRHDRADTLPDRLLDRWAVTERREWGTMAVTMLQAAGEVSK